MSASRVVIPLQLRLQGGILGRVSPAGGARLDDDVAEELVERVAVLPRNKAVLLRVHVPDPELHREAIAVLIKHHFALARERTEFKKLRTVRAGQFALLVGLAILAIALVVAEAIERSTTGALGAGVREGVTIVGWVALWRPLDLLLFDSWALRREIALYRRLEAAEVVVESATER